MKLAFARSGTRHRRALRNEASFYAKRLILVAQMEKNGINKEINGLNGFCRRFSTVD
jgi:hypothetical protein